MSRFRTSVRVMTAEIILAFLLLFNGVMLGFSSGGFVINFNKLGFTVVSSLQKGSYAVGSTIARFFTSIHQIAVLQKEYNELTEKLKDYEYMQRNNAEIRKENERLREQLQFASDSEYKNIAAQIIGRDPDNLYSGITINKGSRQGIVKGMPVIAIQSGNVGIVGKIVEVGLGTAMIMPIYDAKCNISARIQNTRDLGIISGNGSHDSHLKLQYISKRALDDLNHGDIIVTSGENGNYMKDTPIGRISKISVLDYDSSLDIEVDPVIDFLRLENVLVIDRKKMNDRPPLDTLGGRL